MPKVSVAPRAGFNIKPVHPAALVEQWNVYDGPVRIARVNWHPEFDNISVSMGALTPELQASVVEMIEKEHASRSRLRGGI